MSRKYYIKFDRTAMYRLHMIVDNYFLHLLVFLSTVRLERLVDLRDLVALNHVHLAVTDAIAEDDDEGRQVTSVVLAILLQRL